MKRSDKILLTFFLSILVLYGVINLALYARSRQAKNLTDLRQEEGWVTQYKGRAPAFVSVQGNVNVKLLPSDTFFIAYDKKESGKTDRRMTGEDSLLIQGGNFAMSPHDIFQRYNDYPWIEIHAGAHTHIRLTGLLAIVKGPQRSVRPDWDLEAINTQLWIGEAYGNETDTVATEYYDSIQVHATNANLILHGNAVIGKLSAQLDDRSQLNDWRVVIGKPELHYTDRSRINLTGANLDKLRGAK